MESLDLGCGVGAGSDSGDVFYVSTTHVLCQNSNKKKVDVGKKDI